MKPYIAAALAILVGCATAAGTAPGNEENRLLKGNQRNGNGKVYTNLFNEADAIAKKQRDRNEDVGGVSRLRGAFEVGGGGDIASKTGVVKSDGVDEDAILEEDAVSKTQLQINDVGKTNKLLDDELDAFVNEAEAVEDDEGVDHPDVGVSLSTGSTEVEEEEENNYAVDSGEKEDGVEEDDDTGKGVTTFKGASLAVLSATCPADEEKCVGDFACDGADESKIGCGSCNDGGQACQYASGTVGVGSCNDGYVACAFSEGTVGDGSCNDASYACWEASGTIDDGSCNGYAACQTATGTVGKGSCNDSYMACNEASGIIRDGSCNGGYRPCWEASGNIGFASCNGGAHACWQMRGTVGNNACNGGDKACWIDGGYEGDIPDNCPSIAALERGECPFQFLSGNDYSQCPEGLEVSEDDCLDAGNAMTVGWSTIVNRDVLNVDDWNYTPCGCFIFDDAYIDYDSCDNANAIKTDRAKLICKRPKWYPDYQTAWSEAGCLNDIPLPFSPGDRPMYDSELECCNACYAGQTSGACLAV